MKNIQFKDWPLSEALLSAISDMGFDTASPIQTQTIPKVMKGIDVIGQAQTGTGKTAAFGVPIIERIQAGDKSLSTLILCPTRELALQVSEELKRIAKYKPFVNLLAVYGGESIQHQIKTLRRGVNIVVGTPGRIMDHMRRGTLVLDEINTVVLDEADEMLNMGFLEDIELILSDMPAERQTILFSATMPKAIISIAKRFQTNPVLVKVTTETLTASTIEQIYFETHQDSKTGLVSMLMELHDLKRVIVFCNTRKRVDELVEELKSAGHKAASIHGELSQARRNAVLSEFKKGQVAILVATDVAARGIDVTDLDGVFNYDLPHDPEYYVHRIGRTGRAGNIGKAFSFVTGRNELRKLQGIEQYAKVIVKRSQLPSTRDMVERSKQQMIDKVLTNLKEGGLQAYQDMIDEIMTIGYDAHQVAAALLKIQMAPAVNFARQFKARAAQTSAPSRSKKHKPPFKKMPSKGRKRSSYR
jgi:ATP-dependent RNA helicase DeaD